MLGLIIFVEMFHLLIYDGSEYMHGTYQNLFVIVSQALAVEGESKNTSVKALA